MIVSKNATNDTPWFFVNHKKSRYFPINKHIPLWKIIRGSSAAPTYFPSQTIKVDNKEYEFIDGGMRL